MELSLVLDPPSAPSVDAKAPGSDPNDNASQAFASLLAAIVGGLTPQTPEPIEVATPTPDTTPTPAPVALATEPFSSPIRPTVGHDGDQKPEAVAIVPATKTAAAMAPPLVPSTPVAIDTDEPEPDPVPIDIVTAPSAKPVTPKPSSHPSAGATPSTPQTQPVQPLSSPIRPDAGRDGDQNAEEERPPVTVTATSAPTPHDATAKPFTVDAPAQTQAPKAPAPTHQASPAEQVVKAVAPLRKLADGTHHVVLELHPAELGTVRVELSIDSGTVHLGLHTDIESTAQVLHAAVPELRSQLDAAGLVAGRVNVDTGAANKRQGQAAWQASAERGRRRALAATVGPDALDVDARSVAAAAVGRVDVLL